MNALSLVTMIVIVAVAVVVLIALVILLFFVQKHRSNKRKRLDNALISNAEKVVV